MGMTQPLKHILVISNDERLMIQRRRLLEQAGYRVSTALGLKEGMASCMDGAFDLLILGHSIPLADKETLIKTFRAHCPAPIFSLWERGEVVSDNVDYLAFSDAPEKLLAGVAAILDRKSPPPQPKE